MTAAPMRRSDGGDVLYGSRCSAPASEVGVVLYVERRMKGGQNLGAVDL